MVEKELKTGTLGDIALDQADLDGARRHYEQALALYQAIPDPYSAGWTLISLARLDPPVLQSRFVT